MEATELQALRDGIRDVLADEAGFERVAAIADGDVQAGKTLRARAIELGWFALSVPEAAGGLELGAQELAILYHELGRTVTPLPLLGSMLLVEALKQGGSTAQRDRWLGSLATGDIVGAISSITPDAATSALKINRADDGDVRLTGQASHILDGADADLWLLRAHQGDAEHWVLVDRPAEAVRHATVDRTRHFASARFDDIALPADRILAGDAQTITHGLLTHAALAIAADSVGGAEAILEQTLDYLRTREQFGKPIGSFQALKHRCADHQVALVAARALIDEAAADPDRLAFAAKAMACATYARIAEDAVQLHGGIGYTWEHPCHLYLKRAKLNEQLFGGESQWLDAAARQLLAAA
jgi:alkylation response protein AidB-like acyl-CoA dehydrogenase